jgi:hypothetical protein
MLGARCLTLGHRTPLSCHCRCPGRLPPDRHTPFSVRAMIMSTLGKMATLDIFTQYTNNKCAPENNSILFVTNRVLIDQAAAWTPKSPKRASLSTVPVVVVVVTAEEADRTP